jgi:hypothetical protein
MNTRTVQTRLIEIDQLLCGVLEGHIWRQIDSKPKGFERCVLCESTRFKKYYFFNFRKVRMFLKRFI